VPGFERNMSDDMIKKLAEKGGVIQINFGSTFLDGAVRDARNKRSEDIKALAAKENLECGWDSHDPRCKELEEAYDKDHPRAYSTVQKVADHIDHVVKLTSVDHVGFGSDFDGVGDSLPTGLKDVSMYPQLILELMKRGYSDEDIAKIASGNVLRVWESVEKEAARLQAAG
jgi:membrane dipeptidase